MAAPPAVGSERASTGDEPKDDNTTDDQEDQERSLAAAKAEVNGRQSEHQQGQADEEESLGQVRHYEAMLAPPLNADSQNPGRRCSPVRSGAVRPGPARNLDHCSAEAR
jgi:hypothetical protein